MKVDRHNRGAAAVTSLTVRMEFPDGTTLSDWHVYDVLTPDLLLQPGQSQWRAITTTYAEHKRVTREVCEPDFLRVKLLFRDANGRTWLRVNDVGPAHHDHTQKFRPAEHLIELTPRGRTGANSNVPASDPGRRHAEVGGGKAVAGRIRPAYR
jgi:hypothetical protein